ncbi:MAG: hypothetical protein LAT82_01680 [Nanoarchaeota archaeon]|nr:hypothetical protein [Nanoarchaeota archaeon]
MSKIKSFLKVLTLGLAFSSFPNQTSHNNPYPLSPSQISIQETSTPQISSEQTQDSITQNTNTQFLTPNNETIRPQQRPDTIIEGTFEEYLRYLRWIHQTQHINPLENSQILQLRSYAQEILSINESQRTQDQKDFIFIWNVYRYQLEAPLALQRFSQILPIISASPRPQLQVLIERMPNGSYQEEERQITFYPNQINPQLNRFILHSLENPSQLSNNQIHSIHTSYYQLLVGLLLIENNFGRTTTSSADARGPFQIKPQTINWVENYFNLNGRYASMNSNEQRQRELEAGFLHIFQLAQFFNIDISRQPTPEEVALLTFTYFQGINSYSRILQDLDSTTQHQLEQYSLPIIQLVLNNLIIISQGNLNRT